MKQPILFLATVDSHIYYFHIPFMKLLRNMGYEVEVAAAPVGFKEKIENKGFKVYSIPFSRNPLSLHNLKAFFMVLHLMKKQKYIMVHTHTPVASFLGRVAAKIAGIPHIVYTAHGFHFHEHGSKLKNFIYYSLEKFAGLFTDILITINTDDYKVALEKCIIPYGRVVYIKGVGVDMHLFDPATVEKHVLEMYKKKFRINKEDFVVISVAELIKRKNLNDIIVAVHNLSRKSVPVKLLMVGNGVLEKEIQEFIRANEMTTNVTMLGRRSDVKELLSISHVLCMTSLHEGLPKAIMEAMAMAIPVVAYNIRGVRDLVVNGKTGFLVPFKDVEALTEKILYLYSHPDFAKSMGKKGRESIEKEFSLDVVLKQMKDLYEEILGK